MKNGVNTLFGSNSSFISVYFFTNLINASLAFVKVSLSWIVKNLLNGSFNSKLELTNFLLAEIIKFNELRVFLLKYSKISFLRTV